MRAGVDRQFPVGALVALLDLLGGTGEQTPRAGDPVVETGRLPAGEADPGVAPQGLEAGGELPVGDEVVVGPDELVVDLAVAVFVAGLLLDVAGVGEDEVPVVRALVDQPLQRISRRRS
jgi:hypothetical protein